jgi:hypothetical protein
VAAGDFSALLDVGGRQDVADVGQGEPSLLGKQDARDPTSSRKRRIRSSENCVSRESKIVSQLRE